MENAANVGALFLQAECCRCTYCCPSVGVGAESSAVWIHRKWVNNPNPLAVSCTVILSGSNPLVFWPPDQVVELALILVVVNCGNGSETERTLTVDGRFVFVVVICGIRVVFTLSMVVTLLSMVSARNEHYQRITDSFIVVILFNITCLVPLFLLCFDAAGWVTGRPSGLWKISISYQ